MRRGARSLLWCLSAAGLLAFAPVARGQEMSEYRLKSAVLYNFIVYTEWPAETGSTLNLCVQGDDPFGKEIDSLESKAVYGRSIAVQRNAAGEPSANCHIVFVAASAMPGLPRLLESLRGRAVLTVADSPGAMRQGVALNMAVSRGKVTFEANLQAARRARLNLSSKLLRLATEVKQ